MDEPHLLAALRYVALNPVRARLAARAQDWRWSSVHALLGRADGITDTAPVLERVPNFAALLRSADDWLLYAMDSPWSGHARGLNFGRIYTRDGRLVASVAQEGMLRVTGA